MPPNLTQSIEDYLKTIYEVTADNERASTTQLAELLKVTPASVTGMIKKLAQTDPPLVDYKKHQGVILTKEGRKIALETIRHHRLLELFLHQMLDYSWDEVDEEAHILEHVISEKFEDKISKALGDPKFDPHGDPIPSKDLVLPEFDFTPLNELRANQSAVIKRVRDTDSSLLRYLSDLGVIPKAKILVKKFSKFDENLNLTIIDNGKEVVLGPKITSQIFVEIIK